MAGLRMMVTSSSSSSSDCGRGGASQGEKEVALRAACHRRVQLNKSSFLRAGELVLDRDEQGATSVVARKRRLLLPRSEEVAQRGAERFRWKGARVRGLLFDTKCARVARGGGRRIDRESGAEAEERFYGRQRRFARCRSPSQAKGDASASADDAPGRCRPLNSQVIHSHGTEKALVVQRGQSRRGGRKHGALEPVSRLRARCF